jgi:hypothetical protein
MLFKACSGAVTEDFFNENTNNVEPAQLSWLRPNDKTVTLTIGGNDAGFVHILEQCVAGLRKGLPVLFGCSKDKVLREETELRLKALAGSALAFTPPPEHRPIRSLAEVIGAVHDSAPNAQIVVGGYPKLFGGSKTTYEPAISPSGKVCDVGAVHIPVVGGEVPLLVDSTDAQWLDRLASELDRAISQAVDSAQSQGINAIYVEPNTSKSFKHHGLCDDDEAWIHPVQLTSSDELEPASFHPTINGQRLGYEPAFAAHLK